MLKCDGYKMFHGTVKISPRSAPGYPAKEPFDLTGTWLYKPDTHYWYCNPDDGSWTKSISESIMSNIRED